MFQKTYQTENCCRNYAIFAGYFAAFFLLWAGISFAQDPLETRNVSENLMSKSTTGDNSSNEYLIGAGDVLDIRIFNRPELSRESVRVDGRGLIRLPLINEIRAQCRTENDLAQEIAAKYLDYLRNPHVEVFIKDFQSKPAVVLGAVREPGRFQMQRRVHLLELISLAGGATEQAGGRIQVTHSSDITTCEEFLPKKSQKDEEDSETAEIVEWYDIDELLQSAANGAHIPIVRPGDTINLLEADRAFIVGNVMRPSIIPLKEKITISQAVAIAGGVLPDSRLEKVRILRQNRDSLTKSEMIVNLKAIDKQQAEDIVLQANDIVDVPTSSGKKFLRGLLNAISPTVTRLPVRVIN